MADKDKHDEAQIGSNRTGAAPVVAAYASLKIKRKKSTKMYITSYTHTLFLSLALPNDYMAT